MSVHDKLLQNADIAEITKRYINLPFPIREHQDLPSFWQATKIGTRYKTPSHKLASTEENLRIESFWKNPRKEGHIKMRHICGWLPITRVDDACRSRSRALYIPLPSNPEPDTAMHVINIMGTTEDDIEKLFQKKLSVISGKRGVGKTSAVNFWLNEYSDRLSNKHSIIWFKIDASKLYISWKKNRRANPCVCQYFYTYIALDFLIHTRFVTSLGEGFAAPHLFSTIDSWLADLPGYEGLVRRLETLLGDIIKKHSNSSEYCVTRDYNIVIEKSIKDIFDQAIDIADITLLHSLMTNVLSNRTIAGKKITTLIIVDGIDGIETVRGQNEYQLLMEQVVRLITCRAGSVTSCPNKSESQCKTAAFEKPINISLGQPINISLIVRDETLQDIKAELKQLYKSHTYDTLTNIADMFDISTNVLNIPRGEVLPPDINTVLRMKLNSLWINTAFEQDRVYLESELNDETNLDGLTLPGKACNQSKLTALLLEYRQFLKIYKTQISKCVERIYSKANKLDRSYHPAMAFEKDDRLFPTSIMNEPILDVIFNENSRSFIDNFLNTMLLTSFLRPLHVDAGRNNEARRNFSSFLKSNYFRARSDPYRYVKYLLFNGRTMLNTDYLMHRISSGEPLPKGESFYNIFWFDVQQNSGHWAALMGVRILQYLRCFDQTVGVEAREMLDTLSRILGYNIEQLKCAYRRLVEFGLINVDELRAVNDGVDHSNAGTPLSAKATDRETNELEPDAAFSTINGCASISYKGRFYLDFSFIYTEWLYACAIDTPLPNYIADPANKYIKVYVPRTTYSSSLAPAPLNRPDQKELGSYLEAFMTTTATFARLIKHQHFLETSYLDKYIDEYRSGKHKCCLSFDDLNDFKSAMSLPDVFDKCVVDSIRLCARARRINSAKRFDTFKSNIFDKVFLRDIEKHITTVHTGKSDCNENSKKSTHVISAGDKKRVENILIKESIGNGNVELYFNRLIDQSNIPDSLKAQKDSIVSSNANESAKRIIEWAEGKGGNPEDDRYTVLGTILKFLLKTLGTEDAISVAATIMALSEFCVGSCGDDDDCGGSDLTGVPDGTSQISAAAR